MLENIIGQKNTVATLKQELSAREFPQAVLFHGPLFSAKLSTALEVARVLTCQGGAGEWSCSCTSCSKQRLLTHPHTLLLGNRYFDIEIAATADVLRRTRRRPAQFLFIRAVRKLTRRFDPLFWEGSESMVRSLQPVVAEIEERLDILSPGQDLNPALPEADKLQGELERISNLCRKLSGFLRGDNIPINQIRRITSWMHMTASGAAGVKRIIILENVDGMYDASSNSLLKILEEPPEEVFLILITTRKGAIIPTVRSRLRPYSFVDRNGTEAAAVLEKIFHETSEDYQSLREYFLLWKDLNPEQLKVLSRRFIDSVLKKKKTEFNILEDMEPLFSTGNPKGFLSSFLEELTIQLQSHLARDSINPYRLAHWTDTVRQYHQALERWNQNPSLVLESLYYRLSEMP